MEVRETMINSWQVKRVYIYKQYYSRLKEE